MLFTHPPSRSLRHVLSWGVLILLLVVPWTVWPGEADAARVVKVIRGDILQIDRRGRLERVRLIGVDTPEAKDPRVPGRKAKQEALAFTQRLVMGKVVRLEHDHRRQDHFNRPLAYLYLDDGTFVNAEIIRQGYGFVYTRFPFRYLEELQQLQHEARRTQRGLWTER